MFYIWLLSKTDPDKIQGYIVNGVKKPELRVKQSESIQGFAARVREDMIIEPDKYFHRDEYLVSKGALEHFEKFVVDPKIDKLQFMVENPHHSLTIALLRDKNTSECQKWGGAPCPYIDLCRYGKDRMGHLYVAKERKHEELEEQDVE